MWSRALLLQELARPSEEAADRRAARAAGPGRERRRRRHRRRPGRRLQDRIAQPPVVHRAVPGRGDRRRRHHPRHLHDGRAADRAAELAALRPARRSDGARNRRIVDGVVAGIADYGNCFGVPTVGGEIAFDESLHRQPAGQRLLPRHRPRRTRIVQGQRRRASATRSIYVGAKTGRDGIHGATMASAEFDEKSTEKRPDGAGRRSVHGEAAARGLPRADADRRDRRHSGHGRRRAHLLDLRDGRARRHRHRDRPHARAAARDRHDARTRSCSPNRRSACCSSSSRGREDEVERDLREVGPGRRRTSATSPTTACCASRTTARSSPRFPNRALADEAPVYDRPVRDAARTSTRRTRLALTRSPAPPTARGRSCALLGIADHREQALDLSSSTTTWSAPTRSSLAGMRRRRRAHQGNDARARDVARRQRPLLLPRSAPRRHARGRRGCAQRRVRRRACRSAPPTASTSAIPSARRSCGSSSRPIEGIAEACRALDTPITGGNVSLYNETDGTGDLPDAGHRHRRR